MAGKKSKYELEIMIAGETDRSLGASIKRARKEIDVWKNMPVCQHRK
ncbi:MAG: hypothetical protein ACLSEY_09290 [Enterocloster sp.]